MPKNRNYPNQNKPKKRSKFLDVSNEWLSHKKKTLKASSFEMYRLTVEKYILPYVGQMTFSQANRAENVLIKGLEAEKNLSENYRKEIIILYRCIISWFLEEEHSSKAIQMEKGDIEIFSDNEIEMIANSSKMNIELKIMLFTGMSTGEIGALKWEDFDFENSIINVRRTIQRVSNSTVGETSKTRLIETEITPRRVPIAPRLQKIIKDIPQYQKRGRVASSTEPRTIQYKFASVMKQVGLTGAPTKLRDTFAVNAIKRGVNPIFIASVMGTTIDFFYERYKLFIDETLTDQNLRKVVE